MRIVLPESNGAEFFRLKERISEDHFLVIPVDDTTPEACLAEHDHWLGSSRDGHVWVLTTTEMAPLTLELAPEKDQGRNTPDSRPSEKPGWRKAHAILVDPPEREDDTIGEILFRVHVAQLRNEADATTIENILRAARFPAYRPIGSYLPEAPPEWRDLPAELVVSIDLSDGACITGGTHAEYSRDSLEDALRMVCGPRVMGYLLGYSLVLRKVLPHLRWNVDSCLSRRGKERPYRRGHIQKAVPWEREPDPTVICLYQSLAPTGRALAPPFSGPPRVRLRVGGRSEDHAEANWQQCARTLRKMRRQLT